MPKLEVLYAENEGSFQLQSGWHIEEDMYENFYVSTSPAPTYGSRKITLEYKLPSGSEIKSAKVYSEWSYPTNGYGFRVKQINGVNLDDNGMVDINIEDPKATSIDLEFLYLAIPNVVESTGWKYAYTTVSNIKLIIEYTCGVYLYRAEGDKLVPYQLFHAEDNTLVPYQLFHAENGELVQY